MPMEWAPRCHTVLSPILETGLRLEEAQRRQSWLGLHITTEPRLGITQLCVYTFRLVSDAACCTGTMGMVRGCAEDARCHTAHMSSLTYESRLNAGYWLCLRGPIGSQTFQQQQRECSEVDAARRRAPWIPKLWVSSAASVYGSRLIDMHFYLRAGHTTEPCIKRTSECIAWSFAVGGWRNTRPVYMILMTRIISQKTRVQQLQCSRITLCDSTLN